MKITSKAFSLKHLTGVEAGIPLVGVEVSELVGTAHEAVVSLALARDVLVEVLGEVEVAVLVSLQLVGVT